MRSRWTIQYRKQAQKSVERLDPRERRRIKDFLETRVTSLPNPRAIGRALQGPLDGYWRYRVGDYRIVCEIRDSALIVLVIEVDHRSSIYK